MQDNHSDIIIRKTPTLKLILLTIITFGIYWYIWLWKLVTDINRLSPDKTKRIHRYNWFATLIGLEIISHLLDFKGIQTDQIFNIADVLWGLLSLTIALQLLKNIEAYIKDKFDIEIKHNTLGWLIFGSFYVNYKINRLNLSLQEGIDKKIIQMKLFYDNEPKVITLLKKAQTKIISFFRHGKQSI